jgi:tRNA(Ile)-lysidine synthase TilS/MesJ
MGMKNQQVRLRRKIEHEEEIEMDDNNESPIACVDCGKRYPMVAGSSNCRCVFCNGKYKASLHGHSDKLAQIRHERKNRS